MADTIFCHFNSSGWTIYLVIKSIASLAYHKHVSYLRASCDDSY
uniref:Uncharacterized protein n=1 Tax=Arundo donax TaxID=35708 RepID=A0A0A9FD76_ARUDO